MSPAGEGPDSAEMEASHTAFREAATGSENLPDIDFTTFVLSLNHSARVHLGDAPEPGGETRAISLPLARQTIDLLALLQDKTRGNLTGGEEHILAQALYDLRMRFVEVAKGK